ncbi:unnamed protein product [Oikopleura dioica]|nr:unnamed protein product [Oikopleura dioica]
MTMVDSSPEETHRKFGYPFIHSDHQEQQFHHHNSPPQNFTYPPIAIPFVFHQVIKPNPYYRHIQGQQYREQINPESQSDMAEESESEEIDVTDNDMEGNRMSQAAMLRSCISSETHSNSSMSNSFGANFEQLNLTTESGCSSPQRLITPPEGSSRTSSADSRTIFPGALRQVEEHGQYDPSQAANRKFECDYCPKRFVRKEEKLRHERSHTNERKYQCRFCNLRFLRADHRKGHEDTHSSFKKYKCEPCNKSFRRKDEFNRHCLRKICKRNKKDFQTEHNS